MNCNYYYGSDFFPSSAILKDTKELDWSGKDKIVMLF